MRDYGCSNILRCKHHEPKKIPKQIPSFLPRHSPFTVDTSVRSRLISASNGALNERSMTQPEKEHASDACRTPVELLASHSGDGSLLDCVKLRCHPTPRTEEGSFPFGHHVTACTSCPRCNELRYNVSRRFLVSLSDTIGSLVKSCW